LLRLFGKKTIVTIHGLDWKRKKWGLFARIFLKFCEYPAVFFPNKTIIVSQALKEYFEQKFRKKLYFIPNGINVDEISLKENADVKNAEYILFVGRLVPEKGIHYLIKAFNELRTAKKLIIVGRPSFTDTYEEYLRSLARENTEFLGFIQTEDLEKLYRRAYVFVLPSEVEGSSVSLLEAMGYGRCVLVSDIPESLEVVGDCGLSFKSTDYLDLKDKLQYLIDNPGVVSEIGLRAQKRAAEKYNWDSIINELEKLYLSLK
jgi:glycosyltransferase involved in cell wall biosynthesis